jgi:glycosyltransferase involved in cell wall biosynthesis
MRLMPDLDTRLLEFGGRVLTGDATPALSSTGGGISRIVKPMKDILWHQHSLKRTAKREAFDVVHVPTIRRLPGKMHCPTVVTVHDLAPMRMAGKYGYLRGIYHKEIVPRWLDAVSAIVVPSLATKTDLIDIYRVKSEKVRVVPNGLDHGMFYPRHAEASRLRMKEGYGIERPYFVYISRLENPAKNHVRLIEAFAEFKKQTGANHQLVFVGGDWQGSEIIREAGKKFIEAGELIITGFVPKDDMPHFLAAAEAMVYPSLFEGFGLPVIEAMASGVPVACSRGSSLSEIAEGHAILFDPHSPEEMAAALVRLAESEELRNELRLKGLAHAKNFTWERCVLETMDVWRAVAGGITAVENLKTEVGTLAQA